SRQAKRHSTGFRKGEGLMIPTKRLLTIAPAAVVSLAASTAYGQVWTEVGDAPQALANGQVATGVGPLTNISGTTTPNDLVDVYLITIADPAAFYATTEESWGNQTASASFDTRLFLFAADGTPLLANDDIVGGPNWRSLIADP